MALFNMNDPTGDGLIKKLKEDVGLFWLLTWGGFNYWLLSELTILIFLTFDFYTFIVLFLFLLLLLLLDVIFIG